MDVTPLIQQGSKIIQSYAGGRFKISAQVYESAVFVTPASVEKWNFTGEFDDLALSDFDVLTAKSGEFDVVLFGCGGVMRFLPPELQISLKNKGISMDMMDTSAACRTYNVLMAEGRRVIAVLLPV